MKKLILLIFSFSIVFSQIIVVDKNNCQNCDICNSHIHYKSIQTALLHSNYADTIKICPGTYFEDNLKITKSNLNIEGIGKVIISNKPHPKHNIFSLYTYVSNLKLSNLFIQQYNSKHSAIYSNKYVENITLDNLNIYSKGRGIYEDNMISNSTFKNLNITSKKEAIYLKKINTNINILNSTLNSTKTAIHISGWGNSNLSNLNINSPYGIYINEGNTNIENSIFNSKKIAININKIGNVIINNNQINAKDGILIQKITTFGTIQNNNIKAKTKALYINSNLNTLKIIDNNISNAKYGIQIDNSSNNLLIKHNIIKNCKLGLKLLKQKKYSFSKIVNNCFENKKNIISLDYSAHFDFNYYNDLDSNIYTIPKIPRYDYHPMNHCFNLIPTTNNKFQIRELNRTDNNITTKIVNKQFSLEIYTKKTFRGTVCSAVVDNNDKNISTWFKNYFNYQTSTEQTTQGNPNYTVATANKNAYIKIVWIKNQYRKCPLINSNNNLLSQDNFAIRPNKFQILNYPTKIYAAQNYPITLKALDNNNNPSKDYNETNSVILKANQSAKCNIGSLNYDINFSNGISNSNFAYNEVGDVNITLQENPNNPFASVDLDDTPKNQLLISPTTISITSYPYKFYTESNFSKNITYDDKNLSKNYAEINTTIEALNQNNIITKNFDKQCFSDDINISFSVKNNATNSFIGMFNINNNEINDSQFSSFDKNFTISKNLFNNGKANINIKFNIYKNRIYPVSIVDLNFTKLTIYYPKANIKNSQTLDNNLSFYYLKVYSPVIYANDTTTKSKIYILVYDENKDHFPDEKLLNWFIDDKYSQNDIKLLGYTENNRYDSNLSNFYITISKNIYDYNVSIDNPNKYRIVFIHLDTPYYLWSSKYSDLNTSLHSTCSEHYCIEYHLNYIPGTINESNDGTTFKGSGVDIYPQKNKIGIKLYR